MKWLLSLLIAAQAWAQPIKWIYSDRAFDALIQGEQMATIYAHSEYDGSNGAADGTITKPYTTLAAVDAAMGANDTIILGGTYRETWTIEEDGVDIREWTADELASVPGASERYWTIRGDRIASGWAADGTYTNTFVPSTNAPVAKPAGVVIDWDTRVWADGRHAAHLEEAASAALCDATAGTWFWATDHLIVNPPAGVTLSEHVVAWCATGSGLIVEGDDGTAQYGYLYLWIDPAAGNGYGFKGSAVTGWTVTGLEATDCGYHHLGFAVGKCANNWMIGCTATSGNYTCDSYFIVYSSSGDLATSGGRGCVARMSPLLKYTAVEATEAYTDYIKGPSASAPSQTAFGSHTGNSQVIANGGVLWDACSSLMLGVTNAAYRYQAFSNGEEGTEPADKDDAATYSVRFVDCDFAFDWISLGQGTSASAFSGSFAFVRCFLDGRTCIDSLTGVSSTENCIYINRMWVKMESCVLVGETPGADSSAGLIRLRGTSGDKDILRLDNCSFYAHGSTDCFFVRMDGQNETIAKQCVFASATDTKLYDSNTTVSATSYQFSKCWYGDTLTAFGRGASYDSQAEWISAVDANGVYGEDFTAQFVNTLRLEPIHTSRLATIYDPAGNTLAPVGINAITYQGNAGAWQMPSPSIGAGVSSWQSAPGRQKYRRVWWEE